MCTRWKHSRPRTYLVNVYHPSQLFQNRDYVCRAIVMLCGECGGWRMYQTAMVQMNSKVDKFKLNARQ